MADFLRPLLIDGAVQGACLLAATAMLAHVFRRQGAARRHLVWTLGMLAVLAIPVLAQFVPGMQMPLPEMPDLTKPPVSAPVEAETTPLPFDPQSAVANPIVAQPQEQQVHPASVVPAPPAKPSVSQAVPKAERAIAMPPLAEVLVAVWLVGGAFLLMQLLVGLLFVQRIVRKSARADHTSIAAFAQPLAEQLGIRHRVQIRISSGDTMPMAAGLVRAKILLPQQAHEWPEERLRAVLLHELAHVKRRDCLTHALGRLVCSLHWFNPLAWYALRQMRIERESACDDLVLMAGERPSCYAECLLQIARTMHSSALASVAAITMARKAQVAVWSMIVDEPLAKKIAAQGNSLQPIPAITSTIQSSALLETLQEGDRRILQLPGEMAWLDLDSKDEEKTLRLSTTVPKSWRESLISSGKFDLDVTYSANRAGSRAAYSIRGKLSAELAPARDVVNPDFKPVVCDYSLDFEYSLIKGQARLQMTPMGQTGEHLPWHVLVIQATGAEAKRLDLDPEYHNAQLWLDSNFSPREEKPGKDAFTHTFSDGARVEIAGLRIGTRTEPDIAWLPDGRTQDMSPEGFPELYGGVWSAGRLVRTVQIAVKHPGNKKIDVLTKYSPHSSATASSIDDKGNMQFLTQNITMPFGTRTVDVRMGVADRQWRTMLSSASGEKSFTLGDKTYRFEIGEAIDTEEGLSVPVSADTLEGPIDEMHHRFVAIDSSGKITPANSTMGQDGITKYGFRGLKSDQDLHFELQVQDVEWHEFKDVHLFPDGNAENPKKLSIESGEESEAKSPIQVQFIPWDSTGPPDSLLPEYRWRIESEKPLQVMTRVIYLDENGIMTRNTFVGPNEAGATPPVELFLRPQWQVQEGRLSVEMGKSSNGATVATRPEFSVPDGATLLVSLRREPIDMDSSRYISLWEGRFVRDGKTLQTIIFAAAAAPMGVDGFADALDLHGRSTDLPIARLESNTASESTARDVVQQFLTAMANGEVDAVEGLFAPSLRGLQVDLSQLPEPDRMIIRRLRPDRLIGRGAHALVLSTSFTGSDGISEKVMLFRLGRYDDKWAIERYEPTPVEQVEKRVEEFEKWARRENGSQTDLLSAPKTTTDGSVQL